MVTLLPGCTRGEVVSVVTRVVTAGNTVTIFTTSILGGLKW